MSVFDQETLLRPRLRPLDVRRVHHNGAPYFVLSDPARISEHQLFVPQRYGALLALCDGLTDVAEMCAILHSRLRVATPQPLVEELLHALDEAHMLESPRFRERRAQVTAEYRAAPCRVPALAGRGYPHEPQELAALLDGFLEEAGAIEPARPDWARGVGLLSPHIDYARGGRVYAQVWKRAAQAAREADLAVILGTDHYGGDAVTLTRQHYATPLGLLPTDFAAVDALAVTLGSEQAYAGELRHRGEHSLELVLVWLHHLRGGVPLPVVPVLLGSLHESMGKGEPRATIPAVGALIEALRELGHGRRVLWIASGDLAHVGPAFGGKALDAAARAALKRADNRLIAPLLQGDPEAFFAEISRVQDRNNVCGVSPFYAMLHTLGPAQGECTGYGLCPADAEFTSAVSVASFFFQGT